MNSGHAVVKCPFCGKDVVKAFHKPSYLEHKKSSISAKSRITYYRVPESYAIQGDCPECNAKNRDLQAWYDGTYQENRLSHEDRVKRIKAAGLAARIERPQCSSATE